MGIKTSGMHRFNHKLNMLPKWSFKTSGKETTVFILAVLIVLPLVQAVDPYIVTEEGAPDTFVGDIAADFDLRSTTTSDEFNNLVYRIFGSGDGFASSFRITERSGMLYTVEPIDRDSISQCARTERCVQTLDIGVQSTLGAFFRKIQVEILLEDINDIAPYFTQSTETAQFSENSVEGTMASIPGAKDEDVGNNTVVRYYIDTPEVPFDVEMGSNPDGSTMVKLVVKGELDREKRSFYRLNIVAEDGGSEKRTGTVNVNVTIVDVNDNDPVFDKPFYNVTLKEDVAPNDVFETVHASDADAGDNGKVMYKMSANTDPEIAKLFAINATTGELSVLGQLIYIHNKELKVYIEAFDHGLQPRFSQVKIYINILDSSNNPPQIQLSILTGDDVRKISKVSEYANIGAVIAYIDVSDDDTGRNGEVVCISLSDMFETERYADKEYKTVVLKPLNRELVDLHEVTIVCRDNGTPPMNSSVTFTVEVLDENDNPPRFSQVNYFANVAENNRVGEVVVRVTASDADAGDNSKIEYSIINSNGFDFWMDSVSGDIRANFQFDRENISQFTIQVMAADHGVPRLTTTAIVTMTVTDVNDNYPIFSQPNYEFIVNEGDAFNTTVDQLTAVDGDYGENGTVTFQMKPFRGSAYPFKLFPDGTIKMVIGLDREVQSHYEFNVVARDDGKPPLSSSVTVTVIVYDVNDNAPIFVFPDESNNTATIPLSTDPETVSIIIKASDKDSGANSVLSYAILDKNVTELFEMESHNEYGVIKLIRVPGPSEALRYRIRILAEDHGTPRRSSIQTLNVVFIKDTPVENTNLLIAITLGCVTVVISIGIVITICLIRRHDRRRKKDCSICVPNDRSDLEIMPVEKARVHMRPMDVRVGSQSSGSNESLKKVSFPSDFHSMTDSDNSVNDLTGTSLMKCDTFKPMGRDSPLPRSYPTPRSTTASPSDPELQKLDPITVLNIHKSLLQSRDQLWANRKGGHTPPLSTDLLKHHGDNDSESSGETATCDSGRGGSESDIQTAYTQSHDTDHIKTVTFANKPLLHHIPADSHSNWMDPTKNSFYNSPHRHLYSHNQSAKSANNPYRTNPHEEITHPGRDYYLMSPKGSSSSTSSSLSSHPSSKPQGPYPHPGNPGYKHYPPRKEHGMSVTSYDEDDDTTTSGSYTIDNEDWSMDNQSHPYMNSMTHNEAYC